MLQLLPNLESLKFGKIVEYKPYPCLKNIGRDINENTLFFYLLAPSELAEVENNATVASNQTVNVVTSATNNTETSVKSQVNSTKTTNSTSTLKQSNVDSDEDSASGSVDEFSGSGDDSGDGEDAGIMYNTNTPVVSLSTW